MIAGGAGDIINYKNASIPLLLVCDVFALENISFHRNSTHVQYVYSSKICNYRIYCFHNHSTYFSDSLQIRQLSFIDFGQMCFAFSASVYICLKLKFSDSLIHRFFFLPQFLPLKPAHETLVREFKLSSKLLVFTVYIDWRTSAYLISIAFILLMFNCSQSLLIIVPAAFTAILVVLLFQGTIIHRKAGSILQFSQHHSPNPLQTKFITLSFNNTKDLQVLEHNCARIHKTGFVFEIHTDNLTPRYCKICHCVPFEPRDCPCPNPSGPACSHCNKLLFIIDAVKAYPEFIFLDSDLVILNDVLMSAFLDRIKYFDFIAAYAFPKPGSWYYGMIFNSGLMFMRRLDGLNYDELIDIRDDIGANGDQIVISQFVHRYYTKWDVLSLRWHCRFLDRPEHSINPEDCLSFHGHSQMRTKYLSDFKYSTLDNT